MNQFKHHSLTGTGIRSLALGVTVATALCSSAWAQSEAASTTYTVEKAFTFETIDSPLDKTFTQLLGINKDSVIAGYRGSGAAGHPNKGFKLTLPNSFRPENYPFSVQTQVIGINDAVDTDGFYIDKYGTTHGFMHIEDGGNFLTVDFPGTTFNQLLSMNNLRQAAGYYADAAGIDHPYVYDFFGGVFQVLTIPKAAGGAQATSINNNQSVAGFYIDKKGVNHGFLLAAGRLTVLDFPDSTFTQALGVNDNDEVVGAYMDQTGLTHGFLWNKGHFQSIDDPHGVGTTTINGINNAGRIVGFYVDSQGNTDGLLGTPIN